MPKVTQQDDSKVSPRTQASFLSLGQVFSFYISFYKPEPRQAMPTVFQFNNIGSWYGQGHHNDGMGAVMEIRRAVSLLLYPNFGQ